MKRLNSALLILTFLLGACTTTAPTTESATAQSADSSATDSLTGTEAAVPAREAVLSEIENAVSVRTTSTDESISAAQGMSIFEGGSVETGERGRVRLDLMPEGTIVRVGPNSSFSLSKLVEENGEPKTTIELLFGKVFIMLKGGSLNVETPSGVASVRGSLLSVEYDPETKRTSAACMEGDCALQGENGEEIDLPEGQESFIDDSELPMDPFPMDQDEVQAWLDENPDLELFMPDLPNPEDFPDLPDDFDGNMEEYSPDNSGEATPPPSGDENPPQPTDDSSAPDDGGGPPP